MITCPKNQKSAAIGKAVGCVSKVVKDNYGNPSGPLR